MKKIFITGATGHIGNNLVKYLLDNYNDLDINLLVRKEQDVAIDGFNVNKIVGNITNKAFLNQIITENSIVVHSAGLIDITNKQVNQMQEINFLWTKTLVDVCVNKKIAKFIYISSVDAIFKTDYETIFEPVYLNPEKLDSYYGKSKALATNYVLEKINAKLLNGSVLYPSAVIGPRDYKVSAVGQILIDNIHNRIMARIDGGYNFIDVRDLAAAIAYALFNEVGTAYLVTGENVTIDEFFVMINKKLNKKKLPIKLPFSLVSGLSGLFGLYYHCRKVKPVFTKFALKTLQSNHNYNNDLAVRELNLNVRPIYDTISDTIDWFITNGN